LVRSLDFARVLHGQVAAGPAFVEATMGANLAFGCAMSTIPKAKISKYESFGNQSGSPCWDPWSNT
jgi:hypothetical protein